MKKFSRLLIFGLVLAFFASFGGIHLVLQGGIANATRVDESNAGFYNNHAVLKVSDSPLFKLNGEVDQDVLNALLRIINDPSIPMHAKNNGESKWYGNDPNSLEEKLTTYNGANYIETTSADYSNYVVANDASQNNPAYGAVIIKLFETYGSNNNNIDEFTSKWFQVVYRSSAEGKDVLTLYMVEPYRTSYFNGDDNESNTLADDNGSTAGYTYEGNYSQSIIRTNILKDFSELLTTYSLSDANYFMAPKDLPGLWQSSVFQTGTSNNSTEENGHYLNDSASGASGYVPGFYDEGYDLPTNIYSINNGLDGQSEGYKVGETEWTSTIVSNYDDLIWLPSAFEVFYMGSDKDANKEFGVLNDSDNPSDTLKGITPGEEGEVIFGDMSGDGRMGLWQLSPFDLAFANTVSDLSFLRSGIVFVGDNIA